MSIPPTVNSYVMTSNNGSISLYPGSKMGRSVVKNDTLVYFEKDGKNDFKMHVVSGNADDVAKALNISA